MLRRAREAVLADRATLTSLLHDDRCLELVLHESKLANKLLLDPRSLARVIGDADFLVTLADSESLLDYLRRHAHLLSRILDDDDLIARVVEDERTVEALLRNEAVLTRLFDDERNLDRLIEQPHTLDRIQLSDRMRTRMRSSRPLLDQLVADPGFVAELLLEPRVVKKLMSNRMLLRGLLQEEDVQQAFLECMPGAPIADVEATPCAGPSAPEAGEVADESLRSLLGSPELALLFSEDDALLSSLLANPGLRERIAAHPLLERAVAVDGSGAPGSNEMPTLLPAGAPEDEAALARLELARYWNELAPHLDAGRGSRGDLAARFGDALAHVTSREQVADTLAQVIATGDEVALRFGIFQLPGGVRALDDLYQILVAQRYAFDCTTHAPRILDCGAQAGLSTIGFKRAYPAARISTVEPAPALRQAARANLEALEIDDVEHLAHAISPERASLPFEVGTNGRGGSLTPPNAARSSGMKRINVRARPLCDLLRDPVDFLKLDVAGAEAAILEDAEADLVNVKQLFVEMHDLGGAFADSLSRVFGVLARAGFTTQVVPRVGPLASMAPSRGRASSREAFGIRATRA